MTEYLDKDDFCLNLCRHDPKLCAKQSCSIWNAPAADVAPVVHGRWDQIKTWATKAKYRCSVCGREIMSGSKVNIKKYPYCHCGAKMDGDDE